MFPIDLYHLYFHPPIWADVGVFSAMFDTLNKKGMEVLLHFLLTTLDHAKAREEFKYATSKLTIRRAL